jgi:hypothetical protein
MRLLFFILCTLSIVLFSISCETKNEVSEVPIERFPFVNDSVSDLELVCKQLKASSEETVTYELSVLNHTFKTRKILFYHCDMNYGIHCTGGSLVPQNFHCNLNIPYYKVLLANDKMKYHVKMYRDGLDKPKFYWRLVEVDNITENHDFIVLDTINLESR